MAIKRAGNVSKLYGFLNKIKPEIIVYRTNLEIIVDKYNRSKQDDCSIKIEQIISEYEKDVNYISNVGFIQRSFIEKV